MEFDICNKYVDDCRQNFYCTQIVSSVCFTLNLLHKKVPRTTLFLVKYSTDFVETTILSENMKIARCVLIFTFISLSYGNISNSEGISICNLQNLTNIASYWEQWNCIGNIPDTDPCSNEWAGVICDNDGITGLNFSSISLIGNIDTSFQNFIHLTFLDISNSIIHIGIGKTVLHLVTK